MSLTDAPDDTLAQQKGDVAGKEALTTHLMYRVALAYGRFIYKFRWIVLLLWVVIAATSVFFMLQTIGLLGSGDNAVGGSESVQVAALLKNQFHQNSSQALVVLQSSSVAVTDPPYQQEIGTLKSKIGLIAAVQSIITYPTGADGKTTVLIVESHANVDLPVTDLRHALATTSGPAKTYLSGGPAIDDELVHTSLDNVERADLFALPVALLILIVVFGTFIAALLPLILAMVAIPLTLALLYPIALHNSTSTYVLSVASIVGLGIAIDYSLFIVRRFREELALGRPVQEAIGWTLATAGEAILFSGLIVMIGFIGLILIGINLTTSIGIGGALLVVSTVLAALTFLPALLCVLGPRINALRIPYLWRMTMTSEPGQRHGQERFWHTIATVVMKRPIVTLLLVCVILASIGWPIFSIRVGSTSVSSLPTDSEARLGLTILDAQYPAFKNQTIDLVAETSDHSSPLTSANLQKLVDLTNWLRTQPHVASVTSLMQLPASPGTPALTQAQLIALYSSGAYQQNPALTQFVQQYAANGMTYIAVSSNATLDSDTSNNQIKDLRAHISQVVPGLHVLVGGTQATDLDFDTLLLGNFAWTILFVLLTTLVLLTIMFRSIVLPIKAVVMNIISISASYGVLVFVFQWGNFSNILHFTSEGYVNNIILIILFCVLFGLSMDYEVFLLSRIQEEWLHTKNNQYAVTAGLEKTGSVITNAALLFIVVTVAFTFTSELETKSMGIGMTTSVLIDATIIRSLMVPATMRLLGRWNWWFPGRTLPPKQPKAVPEAVPEIVEVS